MCTQAYEQAAQGDYDLIQELQLLLQNPYRHNNEVNSKSSGSEKWFKYAPEWSVDMPGVAFMT
jgi:hypothetical protein